jgi:hypothetical protein
MRYLIPLALLFGTLHLANADTLPIFSTGNGHTNDGFADPHWQYTNSANTTASAFVANNPPTDFWPGGSCAGGPCGPWLANSPSSAWIVDNTANSHSGGNPLSFQTTFDLTGLNPATASISLEWAIDDGGSMFLNGNTVASLPGLVGGNQVPGNWTGLHAVTLNSGFVAGINTLKIAFDFNDNNYEGVRVQIDQATATPVASTVPEPRASILLGTAVLLVFGTKQVRKLASL